MSRSLGPAARTAIFRQAVVAGMDSKVTLVRGDYTIAPGEQWTNAGSQWPVMIVSRETTGPVRRASDYGVYEIEQPHAQLHLCCAACGQSVLCLSPDTSRDPYEVKVADMLAGILSHLRRSHDHVVTS